MTALYPSSVKSFTTKVDFSDTVLAEHVNSLQDEVRSLEITVGTLPNVGSGWVGSFDQITTNWNTLKDRVANIEYGLYTAYNNNTSTAGGSIIQTSGTNTVSLTIQAQTSQTADLLDFKTSTGTVVSKVDASGNIYTSGNQVVPVVYSSSQPSSVPAGTIWVDSSSNVSVLSSQSGIPSGGTSGQSLIKNSGTDYDVTWGAVTNVGTLSSLNVTTSVTAGSFVGDGSSLTNLQSTDFAILTLMGAWL